MRKRKAPTREEIYAKKEGYVEDYLCRAKQAKKEYKHYLKQAARLRKELTSIEADYYAEEYVNNTLNKSGFLSISLKIINGITKFLFFSALIIGIVAFILFAIFLYINS